LSEVNNTITFHKEIPRTRKRNSRKIQVR